jgi:ATP-dependent exoDNAse (exonuclease V) beta subunit
VTPAAAEAELRARDREARREAQRRFDRPLILQAGAGTGKTTTLIGRLLAWTLGAGWERVLAARAARPAARPVLRPEGEASPERTAADVLRGVVAITFTEAAAAEMAGRAARELGALAAGGPVPSWLDAEVLPELPEVAARARALLGALDHLAVRTIHAFCLGLLAEHPLEAGVHPRLQVDAEGRLLEEVVREVVEAALRQGYGAPGDPDLLALAVRGFGPQEIIEALIALVQAGVPSAALREDPFGPAPVRAFVARLTAAGREVHRLIRPRLLAAGKIRNAIAVEKGLAVLLDRLQTTEPAIDTVRAWADEQIPDNLVGHLKKWEKRKDIGKAEASLLADIAAELSIVAGELARLLRHLRGLDPELLTAGRRALAPLLAAVEHELRTRGVATFDSLLIGAEALLARNPDVRSRVRRGIDQLFVDEFQDTDRVQCEILRWIALDGPRDERPGLFLVGDPKQSIYGWRSADLRAYDGFIDLARRHGGEVMSLVENFRSVPAILAEVARVIAPVMIERAGLQPPFEPLLACEKRQADAEFRRGDRAPVEHWISWKKDDQGGHGKATSVEAAELEAAALAADVRALHDYESVPWKEMALLLRGTGDLDTYLEALRRARVPFVVGRDKQYYRRREVIEAAALVRTVIDPGDHLALLTVLRSALVGVPDAALIPLWRRDFPKLVTELAGGPHPLSHLPPLHSDWEQASSPLGGGGLEQGGGQEGGDTSHRNLPDSKALPDGSAPLLTSPLSQPPPSQGGGINAPGSRLAVLRTVVAEAARELPAGIPGLAALRGWEQGLLAALDNLAVLRRSFETEPADVFVEKLRRLFLSEAIEAARYLGPYRLANLDRFFRQLLSAVETGGGDLTAILRALRRSVAESREAEEGRPQDGAADAVQVMTIHGAKGLDFQHVYLAQLHKLSGDTGARTAAGRLDDGGVEFRLFGAPTLGYDRVEAERARVEAAERVRTLYVAMTRAKDRVVLAAVWPENPEAKPVDQAHTHLDLLLSRPDRPTDSLAALWERAELSISDPAGALWRFPALWPALNTEPADSSGAPGLDLPTPAEIARAAAALQADRAAAEAHSARPYGGAASEEAHDLLRQQQAAVRLGEEAGQGDIGANFGWAEASSPLGGGGLEQGGGQGGGVASHHNRLVPQALPDLGAPLLTSPLSQPPPSQGGGTNQGGEVLDREAAMAAGGAVHRALEEWDLAADPLAERDRQRSLLPAYLTALARGDVLERALPRAADLLDRFAASGLLRRLQSLRDSVLARELPVLIPPGSGPHAPVGVVTGAIDLLYRDPTTNEIVVADYKTDDVTAADLQRRAAAYAPQGAAYVRAVQEALDLKRPPRFELWFLKADQVVTV